MERMKGNNQMLQLNAVASTPYSCMCLLGKLVELSVEWRAGNCQRSEMLSTQIIATLLNEKGKVFPTVFIKHTIFKCIEKHFCVARTL